MKKLLVVILLILIGVSTENICYAGTISYRTAYVLDGLVESTYGYSFRKLRANYTGNALKVRRSNDNTELDIGFDYKGDFDIAAYTAFVGENTGYITTFYDQGTNGYNVTQTVATRQPLIDIENMQLHFGNIGDGNIRYMVFSSIVADNNTFYFVGKTITDSQIIWTSINYAQIIREHQVNAYNFNNWAPSGGQLNCTFSTSVELLHQITVKYDLLGTNKSYCWYNNVLNAATASMLGVSRNCNRMGYQTGGNHYMKEVIISPTSNGDTKMQYVIANEMTYYGITA